MRLERQQRLLRGTSVVMKQILILAGDEDIADRLKTILAPAGHLATPVHSIRAGLEIAEHESPDLILADFTLADGTAIEFCEKLRRQLPEFRAPVLCLASPRQAEHYADRAEGGKGPQDWIRWPASASELRKRVETWLGRVVEFYAEEDDAGDETAVVPTRANATAGTLSTTPLARVLHEVAQGGRAGTLAIARGDERIELSTREGNVVGLRATSGLAEGMRAQLVDTGRIAEDAWSRLAAQAKSPNALPTELARRGLLAPADAWEMWTQVGEDLVLSLFAWEWRLGEYTFRASKKEKKPDVALALPIGPLIFEGVRRHYSRDRLGMIFSKRHRLKRALVGIPERPHGLPAPAIRILAGVDNHRTAPEVLAMCGMQRGRFFQMLYAMWVMDLVRFGPIMKSAAAAAPNLFEAADEMFSEAERRRGVEPGDFDR